MKYVVAVEEKINLGNYESMLIRGSVEFDDEECGDQDPGEFGTRQLDVLLRSHRRRAFSLAPEDDTSYIVDHPAFTKES